MINGSVLAPFTHDSSWPESDLSFFRKAVYYYYVHIPGRDSACILRELAKEKVKSDPGSWKIVQKVCNKVIHLAISEISDSEISNLSKNLLIFSNLLLMQEHGLENRISVTFKNENKAARKSANCKFMKYIVDSYASLESAIHGIEQNISNDRVKKSRQRILNLENLKILHSIPNVNYIARCEDSKEILVEIDTGRPEVFLYEFHEFSPIG